MRIGIHTDAVAGAIGTHKFVCDIWGDTVNIASRMDQRGMAGRIHVFRRHLSSPRWALAPGSARRRRNQGQGSDGNVPATCQTLITHSRLECAIDVPVSVPMQT
jgi:class 3 adenylate cyclase